MRHRSLTNSRKHKSKDALALYCARFDFDEPLFYLGLQLTKDGPLDFHPGTVLQGTNWNPLELNHLWSMRRRPDLRSNFCRMLKEGHDWFDQNTSAGRVVCVLTKLVKREKLGEPEEFTLAEIDSAAGKSVMGTIEGYVLPEWCEIYRQETLSRLASIQ